MEAGFKYLAQASLSLFIAYANEDSMILTLLMKHLSPLVRSELITLYTDQASTTSIPHERELHLSTADLILLLVSPDFMASEYLYDI